MALLCVPLVVTACGGKSNSGKPVEGGTATFAMAPNATPNYIFPLASGAYYTISTVSQFQYILFRPLYWYFGTGKIAFNKSLSIGQPPVYSDGNKKVTIKLGDWKWSDGKPITSRDVEFWMNMVKANKSKWAAYAPGKFPDNIVGMKYPDAKTIVFTLDQSYNPDFFTGDELSQITPMPQHVWDKTSNSGAVGDLDRTPAGAVQVYKYLDGEAQKLKTYATNPLWKVVSGPMRLKSFQPNGEVDLERNAQFSGPAKPRLAGVKLLPFTSGSAEFNVLRQGDIDYGYLPRESTSQIGYLKKKGYSIVPWVGWSMNYIPLNFTNPKTGPLFKQLYFRQAMQHLVNQPEIADKILKNYGYPSYGPIPVKPPSPYSDKSDSDNRYPYDPSAAMNLLKTHGWTVKPDGVSTCTSPGTGPSQCGPGVPSGAQASFNLQYTSGQVSLDQEVQVLKGDLSKVGIRLNLDSAPINTVLGNASPCKAGEGCKWDMAYWGKGWVYAPFPSGEIMFDSGGGYNVGGYKNDAADKAIDATVTSSDPNSVKRYGDVLEKDLPALWFPVPNYQISVIKQTLKGAVPQDPALTIDPTTWYLTK